VLRQLHISGLGVIDDVDLSLHPGLNVLTGETGAGKTLVTAGLSLAIGARASAMLVRKGHRAARVQASFDPIEDSEEWEEEGRILLSRSVSVDGRSTARVGGQLVTVSTLAEVGGRLVAVHGQHHAQRLLSPAAQTALLDRFAGDRHVVAMIGMREAYERWSAATSELRRLEDAVRERERELDLLAYQLHEIEGVAPRPGESDALAAEEARLGHAERISELSVEAHRSLGGEEGAADLLASAATSLSGIAELDPSAADLATRATSLAAESLELSRDLLAYAEAVQADPARLDEVRARAASLASLRRKYGATDEDVLAFAADAARRLDELEGADERLAELRRTEEGSRADHLERTAAVSAGRRRRSAALAEAVTGELAELGMDGARVELQLQALPEPGPSGAETVEIRLAGGPRQAPVPLATAASGGELSRTILAIRSVLADLDDVPTLVFDEVDAGVGGRAGLAVGRRLARLAATRQVLVVTHLPQIACFADHHVLVTKQRGSATVRTLDDGGRIRELSRMLAGLDRSRSAEIHAEELLSEASRARAGMR
jgi:DNA repair protein RecN (Recombination protein N)